MAGSARGLGGGIVLGGTTAWQTLHSDWAQLPTASRELGLPLACSVAPRDISVDDGPIRVYSWRELPDEQRYNQMPLDQEFLELDPLAARLPMAAGKPC